MGWGKLKYKDSVTTLRKRNMKRVAKEIDTGINMSGGVQEKDITGVLLLNLQFSRSLDEIRQVSTSSVLSGRPGTKLRAKIKKEFDFSIKRPFRKNEKYIKILRQDGDIPMGAMRISLGAKVSFWYNHNSLALISIEDNGNFGMDRQIKMIIPLRMNHVNADNCAYIVDTLVGALKLSGISYNFIEYQAQMFVLSLLVYKEYISKLGTHNWPTRIVAETVVEQVASNVMEGDLPETTKTRAGIVRRISEREITDGGMSAFVAAWRTRYGIPEEVEPVPEVTSIPVIEQEPVIESPAEKTVVTIPNDGEKEHYRSVVKLNSIQSNGEEIDGKVE